YAQIDMDMIIRAKAVIDTVGHFSRPDIVRLEMRDRNDSSAKEYNEIKRTLDELKERYKSLEAKVEELLKRGS
ncbi:MAG TPA: hypothetical protein VLB01_07030, partial [Thermodesulfobacteriota bacterium]|nr:hypothetical protein [Thermodesulfobacteriota bacterium]